MSKSFTFLVKSYLGIFYSNMVTFSWSHCTLVREHSTLGELSLHGWSPVLQVFLKKMGLSRPLFVYFRPFLITISIIQIEKSIEGVLGFEPTAA